MSTIDWKTAPAAERFPVGARVGVGHRYPDRYLVGRTGTVESYSNRYLYVRMDDAPLDRGGCLFLPNELVLLDKA